MSESSQIFLGVIAAGAVAVPASTMLTAAELQYVLDHCGARAVVLSSDQIGKLRSVRSGLRCCFGADSLRTAKRPQTGRETTPPAHWTS